MLKMDTNLMGSSGEGLRLNQGNRAEAREVTVQQTADPRHGRLPIGRDRHHALTIATDTLAQRGLDQGRGPILALRPSARHDRKVALAHVTVSQLPMEVEQRGARLGQQQKAGGVTVEPMNEFERLGWSNLSKRLDHPQRNAAATMHGQPGGLVNRQQAWRLQEHLNL